MSITTKDENKPTDSPSSEEIKATVTDKILDMMIVSHPHADHTGGLSDRNTFREIDLVGTFIDYGYQYATPTN